MDIKRQLPEDERYCFRCDHYTFKRRSIGSWAFCAMLNDWLTVKADQHSCKMLSIDGLLVFWAIKD